MFPHQLIQSTISENSVWLSFDLSVNITSVSLCTVKLRFLYSTVSTLKSIFGMVVHTSPLQLMLHQLDICIGFWMLRDWLAATFFCNVFLIVLRLVFGRCPQVRFACYWLCSSGLLLALLFCRLEALFFSVLCIIAPDLRRSSRAVLVPVLLLLALWLWFRLCFFFKVTLR